MSSVRFFIPRFVGVILFVQALPVTVNSWAQATPSATDHVAHVRFWKTDLRKFPDVRVMLKPSSGRHPASQELASSKPGYVFNSYIDVPVGRGTLEIFSGLDTHPIVSIPTNFSPGIFFTALLSDPEKSGTSPKLEIIDDSSPSVDATHSQITVRNFVVDLKDVRLTIGDSLSAQFVSGDSFLQMRGFKPATYPLRTVGTDLDGKSFDWNIDLDFRQCRHQTLLIYPDSYGRIRPRLIPDGQSQAAPQPTPADKEGQR